MILDRVDRRVTLITLGGLCAASAALLSWSPSSTDPQAARTQQGIVPAYIIPSWWDGAPPRVRQYFLAWDQFFWQAEQIAPAPALPPASGQPFNLAATLMLQTMSTPGNDALKSRFASLIYRTHRVAYLPFAVAGLDMTGSSVTTRRTIMKTLSAFHRRHGASAFPATTRQALAAHYPLETQSDIKTDLDKLLSSLKVPH